MISKSNKSRPNQAPTLRGRDVDRTDIISLAPVEKELSFEDASLKFRNKSGKWRVSLRQLAEYYGVPYKQASRVLTRNPDLFRDLDSGANLAPVPDLAQDVELSVRDAFSFLNTLNFKKYEGERKRRLIGLRNWLVDSAEKILDGDLVTRAEVECMFDPSTLTDNPKGIARDNNLRRALFIKKTREAHPDNPNTFKRLHDLAHNDQRLIEGPAVPFQQGWHKKLSSGDSLKDHAQKMASFAAIVCGHIEPDEINAFEREVFRGLPEKYIPDYLQVMIETTRQMTLVEA